MIYFSEGYKYQLEQTYSQFTGIVCQGGGNAFVDIKPNGFLTISKGYAWDGASGPAIDTLNFRRGSLIHDALYQLIRLGHVSLADRDKADRLLQQIVLEDGMTRLRAWWVYTAVSIFGGVYLNNNATKILTAP